MLFNMKQMKLYLLFSFIMGNNFQSISTTNVVKKYANLGKNMFGKEKSNHLSITDKTFNKLKEDKELLDKLLNLYDKYGSFTNEEKIHNIKLNFEFIKEIISNPDQSKKIIGDLLFSMLITVNDIYAPNNKLKHFGGIEISQLQEFIKNIYGKKNIDKIVDFIYNIININKDLKDLDNQTELTNNKLKMIFGRNTSVTIEDVIDYKNIFNMNFLNIFLTPETIKNINNNLDKDTLKSNIKNSLENKFILLDLLKQLVYGLKNPSVQEISKFIINKNLDFETINDDNTLREWTKNKFRLEDESTTNLVAKCFELYITYINENNLQVGTYNNIEEFIKIYVSHENSQHNLLVKKCLFNFTEIYDYILNNPINKLYNDDEIVNKIISYTKSALDFNDIKTNNNDLIIGNENTNELVMIVPLENNIKTLENSLINEAKQIATHPSEAIKEIKKSIIELDSDFKGSKEEKEMNNLIKKEEKEEKIIENYPIVINIIKDLKEENKELQEEINELQEEKQDLKEENKEFQEKIIEEINEIKETLDDVEDKLSNMSDEEEINSYEKLKMTQERISNLIKAKEQLIEEIQEIKNNTNNTELENQKIVHSPIETTNRISKTVTPVTATNPMKPVENLSSVTTPTYVPYTPYTSAPSTSENHKVNINMKSEPIPLSVDVNVKQKVEEAPKKATKENITLDNKKEKSNKNKLALYGGTALTTGAIATGHFVSRNTQDDINEPLTNIMNVAAA